MSQDINLNVLSLDLGLSDFDLTEELLSDPRTSRAFAKPTRNSSTASRNDSTTSRPLNHHRSKSSGPTPVSVHNNANVTRRPSEPLGKANSNEELARNGSRNHKRSKSTGAARPKPLIDLNENKTEKSLSSNPVTRKPSLPPTPKSVKKPGNDDDDDNAPLGTTLQRMSSQKTAASRQSTLVDFSKPFQPRPNDKELTTGWTVNHGASRHARLGVAILVAVGFGVAGVIMLLKVKSMETGIPLLVVSGVAVLFILSSFFMGKSGRKSGGSNSRLDLESGSSRRDDPDV